MNMFSGARIGAVALLAGGWMAASPPAAMAVVSTAMPAAQQNALVQKYCAVCHDDAHMNGGLSLEHFDAARADPGVAAMMVSKMKSGALGAAGIGVPDKATQDALLRALSEESTGADKWAINRDKSPATQAAMLTASVVQALPSTAHAGEPSLYRLILTCAADTHEGAMQLAWSPSPPAAGRSMTVAVDGKPLFKHAVEGTEKMGNGASGSTGPGSAVFYTTSKSSAARRRLMPLPAQHLTISDLFPDETVVFPFGGLTPADRQALAACFSGA
jgi:hypothetical protein